nr:hypothetical protein [uncultured Flavobacterium sp.]
MKKYLFLLFSFLFFVSCCDNNDEPKEKERLYLPVKYSSPTFVETYAYDDRNRLSGIYQTGNNNSFSKTAEAQYENNVVKSLLVNYISSEELGGYSYTEQYTFYREVVGEIKVIIQYVDNHGYESQKTDFYKVDPTTGRMLSGFGIYTEYDERGNMIKFQNQLNNVQVFYDDKRGIYSDVRPNELPLAIIHKSAKYFKVNNPIKFIDTDMHEELYYEYNEAAFPVKMTAIDDDEETVFLYEYLEVKL